MPGAAGNQDSHVCCSIRLSYSYEVVHLAGVEKLLQYLQPGGIAVLNILSPHDSMVEVKIFLATRAKLAKVKMESPLPPGWAVAVGGG